MYVCIFFTYIIAYYNPLVGITTHLCTPPMLEFYPRVATSYCKFLGDFSWQFYTLPKFLPDDCREDVAERNIFKRCLGCDLNYRLPSNILQCFPIFFRSKLVFSSQKLKTTNYCLNGNQRQIVAIVFHGMYSCSNKLLFTLSFTISLKIIGKFKTLKTLKKKKKNCKKRDFVLN